MYTSAVVRDSGELDDHYAHLHASPMGRCGNLSVSEHVKIVGQSPQNSYVLSNWKFEIQEVPIANIHPPQQGHDHRRLKLMRMSYIHVNVALFV